MNITVPDRAEYLRTIVAEVQRIIGHQFWIGTQALDIGAMGVFFYCFRDREILMDWFDELCGARLTTSWYRIGGVERDFTPSLIEKLKLFLDYFPPKSKSTRSSWRRTGFGSGGPRESLSSRRKTP